MNQARIIRDLKEIRPFGEHLLPRYRQSKMDVEKEQDSKGNKKGAFLEAQPYKMFYAEATRQIDLLRSIANPLNYKVISSFSQDYQAMVLSLNKTINSAGVQLHRMSNLSKEIKDGIELKIEKRCDQFLVKMRVVANKLESMKAKAKRIDDYITFLMRCTDELRYFYEDAKADRDFTVELPARELFDVATYLSLMTSEIRKEIEDVLEVVARSKDDKYGVDYMASFGETIQSLFSFITVLIPRANAIRDKVSKVMLDCLGRQPVDGQKQKVTVVAKIQNAFEVRNKQQTN